jgi:hypothetical protein
MAYQMLTIGVVFYHVKVSWYYELAVVFSFMWWTPFLLGWYALGRFFAPYLQRTLRTIHFRLACLSFISWGVVWTVAGFIGIIIASKQRGDSGYTEAESDASPYKKFINRCLHNAQRPAEKWCKERIKVCHPDKYPSNQAACDGLL